MIVETAPPRVKTPRHTELTLHSRPRRLPCVVPDPAGPLGMGEEKRPVGVMRAQASSLCSAQLMRTMRFFPENSPTEGIGHFQVPSSTWLRLAAPPHDRNNQIGRWSRSPRPCETFLPVAFDKWGKTGRAEVDLRMLPGGMKEISLPILILRWCVAIRPPRGIHHRLEFLDQKAQEVIAPLREYSSRRRCNRRPRR